MMAIGSMGSLMVLVSISTKTTLNILGVLLEEKRQERLLFLRKMA
jgi:hypothetical protein